MLLHLIAFFCNSFLINNKWFMQIKRTQLQSVQTDS